jgi:uncharacterized protein YndB with AHSA1/START domain
MAEKNNELIIHRVFNAPRSLVWKAWTEPDRIRQWLAPRGFTIPTAEGEQKPGGRWRQVMITPEGKELRLGGEYREVDPPSRLVFTQAWDDENETPGHETIVSITFVDRGDETEMHFRQGEFKSAESRDGHAGGWGECFDKLEEYLSRAP